MFPGGLACLRQLEFQAYPVIFEAGQAVVRVFRDHERGEVGSVARREDDSEQCPDVGEEATGYAARIVHCDCRAEQHRPNQPERPEERETMFCLQKTTPC